MGRITNTRTLFKYIRIQMIVQNQQQPRVVSGTEKTSTELLSFPHNYLLFLDFHVTFDSRRSILISTTI